MPTQEPSRFLQVTDSNALELACRLLGSARHASLGVLQPGSGMPALSRVALGHDALGLPLILISGLSAHCVALQQDPRCGLLVGEPGAGDPLAHPRLSLECLAERTDDSERSLLRVIFVAWQPKARLYVDFADFSFWRLRPQAASLNGGFGKAWRLEGQDLQALLQRLGKHPPPSAGQ